MDLDKVRKINSVAEKIVSITEKELLKDQLNKIADEYLRKGAVTVEITTESEYNDEGGYDDMIRDIEFFNSKGEHVYPDLTKPAWRDVLANHKELIADPKFDPSKFEAKIHSKDDLSEFENSIHDQWIEIIYDAEIPTHIGSIKLNENVENKLSKEIEAMKEICTGSHEVPFKPLQE